MTLEKEVNMNPTIQTFAAAALALAAFSIGGLYLEGDARLGAFSVATFLLGWVGVSKPADAAKLRSTRQ